MIIIMSLITVSGDDDNEKQCNYTTIHFIFAFAALLVGFALLVDFASAAAASAAAAGSKCNQRLPLAKVRQQLKNLSLCLLLLYMYSGTCYNNWWSM